MTQEDLNLKECLIGKVSQFRELINRGTPYVWELRLSLDEFNAIENAIKASIESHHNEHSHLLCEDLAPIVVIYFAEWYKRFYNGVDTDGESRVLSLSYDEMKKLYDCAKIDSKVFVYNASKNPEKTSYRWVESLQILGGLAIQAELNRDDNSDKLLTMLCRIFHGEELNLAEFKDGNRAVAFQESIRQEHSLFHYLQCILKNRKQDLPFAQSDLEDPQSDANKLIRRILTADKDAIKDKFDFEWLVYYSANTKSMVRQLKVRLKPEQVGGIGKEYLGYNRLINWNITHPENIGRLAIYAKFLNKDSCVKDIELQKPLLQYHNKDAVNGFTAINCMGEAVLTDIPVQYFDTIQLVLKCDDDRPIHVIQSLKVEDYIQVYKTPKSNNEWCTRKKSQAATAVIFSSRYHLADGYQHLPVEKVLFKNRDACGSGYYWCPINDKVVLADENNREIDPPFFNRNGLYQVVARKYIDTIKYKENVFVSYKYTDLEEPADEQEEIGDDLRVLFGRDGLIVLHYPDRNAVEGTPLAKEQYEVTWTDSLGSQGDWKSAEPNQGVIRIKVDVPGLYAETFKVYYVPFVQTDSVQKPIWRDFENHRICTALNGVNDINDDELSNNDTIPLTLENTTEIREEKLQFDIYRPVILRELLQKKEGEDYAKVVDCCGVEGTLQIPLINCGQFSVRDFSRDGVKTYQCESAPSLYYAFPRFSDAAANPEGYNNAIRSAKDIMPSVPLDYLNIYVTKAEDNVPNAFLWNYNDAPSSVNGRINLRSGIIFQSLKGDEFPRHYSMPTVKRDPFRRVVNASALETFDIAVEHKIYFFFFDPLKRTVSSHSYGIDLLFPLMQRNNFQLSDEDVENLSMFAVQFHFDWMIQSRAWWMQQISSFTSEFDVQEQLRGCLLNFFGRIHKYTDSNECCCLLNFLGKYWQFDIIPDIGNIPKKALSIIKNGLEAGESDDLGEFLKLYDTCRFKFAEMSKVTINEK